jgi:hypothetical protein
MPWVDLSDSDPGGTDHFVRAALRKCWHSLPPDRQSIDEAERIFRKLVDRALRDLREDADEFPKFDLLSPSDADPEA